MWPACLTECSLTSVGLQVLGVLGAFQLLKIAITFLNGFFYLIYSGKNLSKYGSWAVVTGSTDGIGLEYAKQMAKQKKNVVLMGRNEEKLKNCQKEIETQFKVQVKYIVADFSSADPNLYSRIETELDHLDVGILVNNVGVSYPHAQYFVQVDDGLINDLINVNVYALTKMTKIVLPKMIEKKKGIIINVGSAAGVIPIGDPLYSVYSGTKAYVDFFSKSLNLEYQSKGIVVENQIPYFVSTKLSKIRNSSMTIPSPKTYVASAVSKIGYSASSVPFTAHAIQHWLLTSIPEFLVKKIVLSHHLGVYKKAMKKMEKKE